MCAPPLDPPVEEEVSPPLPQPDRLTKLSRYCILVRRKLTKTQEKSIVFEEAYLFISFCSSYGYSSFVSEEGNISRTLRISF